MLGEYTTKDGVRIWAYSTMYMDYGLVIEFGGVELYSSPHALSNDAHGSSACEACADNDMHEECEHRVEWTAAEWAKSLEWQDDELIEAFAPGWCDLDPLLDAMARGYLGAAAGDDFSAAIKDVQVKAACEHACKLFWVSLDDDQRDLITGQNGARVGEMLWHAREGRGGFLDLVQGLDLHDVAQGMGEDVAVKDGLEDL